MHTSTRRNMHGQAQRNMHWFWFLRSCTQAWSSTGSRQARTKSFKRQGCVATRARRSPELCVKIGSSLKSQHAKGQAADFEIFGLANAELAKYIIDKLNFDQLILEFHNPEEPNSGWIHCSYKNDEDNRKQVLRAYRNDDGKTVYEPYDPS